jgi:hypothetical protein
MNRPLSKVAGLRMRIERPAAIWTKPGESKPYSPTCSLNALS